MNPFTKLSKTASFAQRRGYKGILVLFVSKLWRAIGKSSCWHKSFFTIFTVNIISYIVDIGQFITHRNISDTKFKTVTKSQIDTFISKFPTNYSCIITTCDQLINNRLYMAAIGHLDIASSTVWTKDLLTYDPYPKTLANDYHNKLISTNGDPRLLWELNRLHFLVTLAQGYILTENEDYLTTASRIIDSWSTDNTFRYGVNWADTQEVGLRMTSLILSKLLFESAGASINCKIPIQQLIREHSDFVLFNLSLGRATHNHLLTELASLLIYSLTASSGDRLQNLKQSLSSWLLQNEINKQLNTDGISKEQSTNYTFFVYDAILLANYIYFSSCGRNLVNKDLLSKMVNVINSFSIGERDFIKIGDADCGRHSKLSWNSDLSRLGYIAVIENLFLIQGENNTNCSEELFWLQPDACQKYSSRNSDQPSPHKPHLFKDSGFMTFSSNNRKLSLRLGPTRIDPDVRFGHAHSDYLSFSLYIHETPIFIDPGTKTYLGPDSKRTELRSAMNHNTVTLDSAEFLDINTYTFGIPELLPVFISDLAEHDSHYSIEASFKYKDKGVIRRIFVFDKCLETFAIVNYAQSTASKKITERYALSCETEQLDAEGCTIDLPHDDIATLNFFTADIHSSSVTKQVIEYAPRYAQATNGTLLNRETPLSNGHVTTYTIIRLTNNAPQPKNILHAISSLIKNDFP